MFTQETGVHLMLQMCITINVFILQIPKVTFTGLPKFSGGLGLLEHFKTDNKIKIFKLRTPRGFGFRRYS